MTYKGKPDEFWREQFEKLKGRTRVSVREVQDLLGYSPKSTAAAVNALFHFERLGLVEHDPAPKGEWKIKDKNE